MCYAPLPPPGAFAYLIVVLHMVTNERKKVLLWDVLVHFVELGLPEGRPVNQNSGRAHPGRALNRARIFRVHLVFVELPFS